MKRQNGLYFSNDVIVYPLLIVLFIWIIYWFETMFSFNFNYLGIYPREIIGLRGVILAPFIHGSLEHLFNNSVPLFALTVALFYFYRNVRWRVLLLGLLLTGLCTWIIGRPSNHIGASGVVYMLTAFLFFRGIFSKNFQLTALSLVVVFLYGGLLWYLFPVDPQISWEGHLSGFFVGLFFAFIFKENTVEQLKYKWQEKDFNEAEDPFISQFDEHGNFIEIKPIAVENRIEKGDISDPNEIRDSITQTGNEVKIVYTYRPNLGSDKIGADKRD